MTADQSPGRGVGVVGDPRLTIAPRPGHNQARVALAMTEDDLLASVLDLCRHLRLRTAHFRPARTEHGWRTAVSGDGQGWPDVTIVGRKLVIRELKTERGRVVGPQAEWLLALQRAGVDADVWRPTQWVDGTIQRHLRELAVPA